MFTSLVAALIATVSAVGQTDITSQGDESRGQAGARQDEREPSKKERRYLVLKDQGLALGIDLSPFIMRLIKDERTGLAFVGRYGIKQRLYGCAELGYEHIKYNKSGYSYKSDGSFIRLGVDYDLFNSEDFPTNDNIFIGARYAYAWQTHQSDGFTIVDSYWGDYTGSVGKSSVNSHSLDLLGGIRCEMLRNFYMGWTFRMRILMASAHSDELQPYAVAGYGKYDSRVTMGFTYTLEYQIPFNKMGKKR